MEQKVKMVNELTIGHIPSINLLSSKIAREVGQHDSTVKIKWAILSLTTLYVSLPSNAKLVLGSFDLFKV